MAHAHHGVAHEAGAGVLVVGLHAPAGHDVADGERHLLGRLVFDGARIGGNEPVGAGLVHAREDVGAGELGILSPCALRPWPGRKGRSPCCGNGKGRPFPGWAARRQRGRCLRKERPPAAPSQAADPHRRHQAGCSRRSARRRDRGRTPSPFPQPWWSGTRGDQGRPLRGALTLVAPPPPTRLGQGATEVAPCGIGPGAFKARPVGPERFGFGGAVTGAFRVVVMFSRHGLILT